MRTVIKMDSPGREELALAQAGWDRFLQDTLAKIDELNPDLRMDLALDKTIRALGRRPQRPLTWEERQALILKQDVEQLLVQASRPRNYGQKQKKEQE